MGGVAPTGAATALRRGKGTAMTSGAIPIDDQVGSLRRFARVLRRLMARAGQIDLHYVDPWERSRR